MPKFLVSTSKAAKVVMMAFALVGTSILIASDAPQPREHHVEIQGFLFVPETIDAKPGDIITWTNRDIAPHTATAKDKSWDTGLINKDESKSVVVSANMDSNYFCLYHPSMLGEVIITTD